MFAVYEVLLYLVFLITLPLFLFTGLLRGKYLTNFPERLGHYRTPTRSHDLWIHAVSVGEAIAARTVVTEIQRMRPGTSIVMTTTTMTGQAQARRMYPDATVAYFPFDFSFAVRRFLDHHKPRVFATMETEIWPNVTRIARGRGMRLVLANGRISDRSFPRYRAFRRIVGRILRNYDRVLAREETDRDRFEAIGATNVEITGNVKFDYQPDPAPLTLDFGGRKVLILGSTMEGEDEALVPLLDRFIREHDAAVVVAPRKAERFDVVARLLDQAGLKYVRRSGGQAPPPVRTGEAPVLHHVLLLDTFGELARVYRYGTAAFVGGTIAPSGGHNPIEPAAAGVPVCFGPSMTNFREIASAFLASGGAVEVRSAPEVIDFAARMFENAGEQHERGERARDVVERNRGASERTARRIVELLA